MKSSIRWTLHRVRRTAESEDGFGLVETLISFTILVIGLLAVTGLTMASATQARVADRRADVATAGQLTIETIQLMGYDSAVNRTDTISVGGQDYPVTLTVTNVSARVIAIYWRLSQAVLPWTRKRGNL